MFTTEFLLKLINRDNISRYIYTFLFLSLITVFDFLTLYLGGRLIGILLYLAIITSMSLIGVTIIIRSINKKVDKLEEKHSKGVYPSDEFEHLSGLFLLVILVIFPGIVSTTIGLVLYIPYFRQIVGRNLTKRLNLDWNAVYEYKEIFNK